VIAEEARPESVTSDVHVNVESSENEEDENLHVRAEIDVLEVYDEKPRRVPRRPLAMCAGRNLDQSPASAKKLETRDTEESEVELSLHPSILLAWQRHGFEAKMRHELTDRSLATYTS
jgi:hypothetical protein